MISAVAIGLVLALAPWLATLAGQTAQLLPIACLGAGALVAGLALRHRNSLWDWRWGAPLSGLLAFVAVQALNRSHVFSPDYGVLAPVAHLTVLPRSVDRAATLESLMLLAGYAAAFWLARVFLWDRPARVSFVALQVAGGTAMAIVTIAQRSHVPAGALYPLTGAFVSPNHYAAFANMLLPLALLWGRQLQVNARERGTWFHAGYLYYLAAAVLCVSVLRCSSRMGVVVAAAVVTGCAFVETAGTAGVRRRLLGKAALVAAGLLGVAALAWVMVARSGDLGAGLRLLEGNVQSRMAVYRAVMAMWTDRWFGGIGAGTFAMAFPFYQPDAVAGFFRHAHNEYLQFIAELGAAGCALLAWTAYAMGVRWPCGDADAARLPTSRESWGIVLALGALGLHAMTDFPLRLPALSLLAAALVGMSGGWLPSPSALSRGLGRLGKG